MKEKSSASKNSVHLSSLHREKKEWFIFPRFPKRESISVEDVLTLGDKVNRCMPWKRQDGQNELQYERCKINYSEKKTDGQFAHRFSD